MLAVLAALYLRCGSGWGLRGGGGTGTGTGTATSTGQGAGSAPVATPRCAVRVTAKGLELAGQPSTQEAIIRDCPQGVDVVVTGDARQGDWDALRGALDSAHVPTFTR